MLSATPAVPLSSIDFADPHGRRLSLRTAHGREFFTHRDGLPSPEHLTPVSGTPVSGGTPLSGTPVLSGNGTPLEVSDDELVLESANHSRTELHEHYEDGQPLYKVPSNGGIWHDDVSNRSCFQPLAPLSVPCKSFMMVGRRSQCVERGLCIRAGCLAAWLLADWRLASHAHAAVDDV